MTYRDFAGGTKVFDRRGRRGLLIFDEEPGNPTIGDCRGWIAYQMFGGGEFERVSEMTTWKHAEAVLGPLHASTYRGPNIPASYKGSAADLDLIMARLSSAGLAG
ncbi:hypothetical protein MMAG44476_39165 [Mycolicibacterium mageritense DSM 44476 = CIP 104973]|jgi:hypothetical protein|uniref:Lipoprotein n=2 Tax=Mycolicibacterium TaxID=1866885 RepID=A0A100WCZ1_MYCCR|nr:MULTISPECIES: hypothetical protein [Mycolicibacterium]MCC9184599.1 hypothetical protein [Mycolicibacterium mageritense]MCV7212696.1 hypothetical protein [Mycolicibacterium canariasense]CDO25794.1 hypothetical protein BN978_06340 [Mycolicibacterium mageritense DSM 44476 = CIP 104973]BBX37541.1 hypothetical protein MMAGJ_68230 [Mycolicibacterium mageritense]GAS95746.1 lipoprotein [Mycolicibacterium canariasense]